MKFSYSWLNDHLDTSKSAKEIADKLNDIGFEVEDLEDASASLRDITVARVDAVEDHPNADRLHVCRVFDGAQTLQIVCGAPNVYGGMKTALVHVGGFVPQSGQNLKAANIRGVASQGMMCSAAELKLGMEVDGILDIKTDVTPGMPLAHALGLDDPVFTISITPNRGDCFSVRGIARELAAAEMGTLKPYAPVPNKVDIPTLPESPVKVFIDTPNCAFFVGAVVRGVHNCFSPLWMQKRLLVAGQRPIDALVDITNFLNFDIGQPLHVYDCQHISGEIHVRQAREGEVLPLLNGQECRCSLEDMLIADEAKPLTLAGVMGGEKSGSSLDTTDVFLEAAYFDPVAVTLTGQRHILHSESRTRFERGIDPEMTPIAMEWMLALIQDICGGQVCGCSIMSNVDVSATRTITFTEERIESLSGDVVENGAAEKILQRLGFRVIGPGTVQVPSWRHDVSTDADLIEEILRMRGYANLPIQSLPAALGERRVDLIGDIKQVLSSRGMLEVYTLPFMSEAEITRFDMEGAVEILKPLNADMAFLQMSLVPALLKVVALNQSRNCFNGAIFEIESVFGDGDERRMLCGMRFGMTERNWLEPSRAFDIFDAKADLMAVLEQNGMKSFQVRTGGAPSYYHPQRVGVVARGKEVLGYFGELHPRLADSIMAFEMVIPAERRKASALFNYSKLQPIVRDFAFLVDNALPANNVVIAAEKVDPRIACVKIFDVFEFGVQKSVAIEVTIQPQQATLIDEDIQSVSQAIVNAVQNACNGTLR